MKLFFFIKLHVITGEKQQLVSLQPSFLMKPVRNKNNLHVKLNHVSLEYDIITM